MLVLLSIPAFQIVHAQTQGGTAVLAYYQEPELLLPYVSTQTVAQIWERFMYRGLVDTNPAGEYIPDLAVEVPSVKNGGVSEDGLTITYHLKDNIVWSDGDPFDCEDVVFTYDAIVYPDGPAASKNGYTDIASVTCPDPYTVEVVYKQFYAPFLGLFGTIIPSHIGLDLADQTDWPLNRFPDPVLGPFKMKEWVSGDHATLVRNENYEYWASEGRPYLDALILRVVESREVGKQLLISGEVDFVWDLSEADQPALEGIDGIRLNAVPGVGTERLVLNWRDPEIDALTADQIREDPHWHWALGDVRVRRAIEAGINKQEIVDNLLYGLATVGTTELNLGWAKTNIEPSVYDPDLARQLLEEAGWTDTDGDGIRECHGCLYAEEGRVLRLKYQTTSGNALREQSQQLIVARMREIGIEFYLENVPSAELFGSYASGAFRRHGHFDIIMFTTSPSVDPQNFIANRFSSVNIPSELNGGSGDNYYRWVDDELDSLVELAGSTPDQDIRRDAYQKIAEMAKDQVPMIYLYDRAEVVGLSSDFMGYEENIWANAGYGSDKWWLDR